MTEDLCSVEGHELVAVNSRRGTERVMACDQQVGQLRTWEEVEEGFKRTEPYDESDPDLFHALHDLFSENKREILGARSHYVLDTLVTLPQHERKGAGSMLVRWGTQRADEAGVEAYLEASPMGAPMYARHGFEPMKKVALDLTKYEGEEVLEFIVSTDLTDSETY